MRQLHGLWLGLLVGCQGFRPAPDTVVTEPYFDEIAKVGLEIPQPWKIASNHEGIVWQREGEHDEAYITISLQRAPIAEPLVWSEVLEASFAQINDADVKLGFDQTRAVSGELGTGFDAQFSFNEIARHVEGVLFATKTHAAMLSVGGPDAYTPRTIELFDRVCDSVWIP